LVDAAGILEKVRKKKPLVHHVTNWVTIYDCANVVRMVGALPAMAHAIEESAEMQGIANALVLNIGTLTPRLVESMISAAKKANEMQHPVVLDAVGVGATALRTEKAIEILNRVDIDVLKGNKSEIAKLAGADVFTKGVEAVEIKENVEKLAKKLAKERGNTVVVTGEQDVVASAAGKNYLVKNGHPLLGKFVGTGCMVASLLGCFAAIENDTAKASAAALSCFGIGAELAAQNTNAPASFKQQLFDELYSLKPATVKKMQKVEEFK